MNRNKIIYWVATGLLTAMLLMSSSMYLFQNDQIREVFTSLGFPTWLIYPLVVAKILGLLAIWTRKSATLKEWAYAGFFYDFLIALAAHMVVGDGQWIMPAIAMILLAVSYWFEKKTFSAS